MVSRSWCIVLDWAYLVHGMAIHSRVCQSGLVADHSGSGSVAILSWPGRAMTDPGCP